MRLIIMFAVIINFLSFGYAEMKVSDFWNPDGSSKGSLWKDLRVDQKTQIYEWRREETEYMLKNIGKKCSELKNIPKYVKFFALRPSINPPRTFGPNDDEICFSSDILRHIYNDLEEYDKWFKEEQKYYENSSDKESPYAMLDWLSVLLSAGRYREAEKFFPSCVNSLYPWFSEKDVIEGLEKGEGAPKVISQSMMVEPWEWILKIKNKPDDLMRPYKSVENKEISERMHKYFYSKDNKKKAEALDFYYKNNVKFMVEKAHKNWKATLKTKAEKYLEELKKSTIEQIEK